MLRVHRIVERTAAEGPGMRFCLWVQGCHNACPHCFMPNSWDPAGGTAMAESAVIDRIRAVRPTIEGVTLLGGEPMEQAAALVPVAEAARGMGLSVMTFTGLVYEDILRAGKGEGEGKGRGKSDPARLRLLALTDLLVDGPYVHAARDLSRPFVGSKNQRFLFLTDRYTADDIAACSNRFELRIDPAGALRVNGMGDVPALCRLLSGTHTTKR